MIPCQNNSQKHLSENSVRNLSKKWGVVKLKSTLHSLESYFGPVFAHHRCATPSSFVLRASRSTYRKTTGRSKVRSPCRRRGPHTCSLQINLGKKITGMICSLVTRRFIACYCRPFGFLLWIRGDFPAGSLGRKPDWVRREKDFLLRAELRLPVQRVTRHTMPTAS